MDEEKHILNFIIWGMVNGPLKNGKSWQILPKSWNLAEPTNGSWSLRFCSFSSQVRILKSQSRRLGKSRIYHSPPLTIPCYSLIIILITDCYSRSKNISSRIDSHWYKWSNVNWIKLHTVFTFNFVPIAIIMNWQYRLVTKVTLKSDWKMCKSRIEPASACKT